MSSHHNSSPPPQGGGGGPAPGPGPVPLVPHHPHPVHHVHRHSHSHHRSSSMIRADLLDLARHLRQERLYIAHERSQLQELNDKVALSSEKLSHTAWVAHQQRENMDELIFASRGVELISPGTCVQRSNLLEQTLFQDSYKCLSYQEVLYCDFLRTLRSKPSFLASCLTAGDKLSLPQMSEIVSTVFSGLYGSCLMPEDELLVLRLLHSLMESQLISAANPRKLLRQGNCAFSRLYKAFNEELFSAKLFLTSALYEPILKLLTDDEMFLDIDPSKAVIRFPPQERLKKFGQEGTPAYEEAIKEHRLFIIGKLEALTNSFITGIRKNLHCFPPSLARLLRTMYSLLMSSGRAEPREVNAVCVDVIFDLFICPAMVDPNPVGIIDTPISYIARSNLMQVAQILQVLALWKWEDIDPRLMDLYSRFDKEVMSSVLEAMLEAGEISEEGVEDVEIGGSNDSGLECHSRLTRLAALMTRAQLDGIIGFLRSLRDSETPTEVDKNELINLLQPIPPELPGFDEPGAAAASGPLSSSCTDDDKALSNKAKKTGLANRISNAANSLSNAGRNAVVKRSGDNSSNNSASEDPVNNGGSASGGVSSDDASPVGGPNGLTNGQVPLMPRNPDLVLVIPILDGGGGVMPGFLSEEHVLNRSRQASRVVRMNLANLPGGGGGGGDDSNGCAGEKRTRFSLSHDGEGSIGNTSDNLEVISEASNHSDSSMEDDEVVEGQELDPMSNETLLNDLVSANVSGRGTPNVSGRDTPSSQVTEGDELVGRGEEEEEDEEGEGADRGNGARRAAGDGRRGEHNAEGRDQGDNAGQGIERNLAADGNIGGPNNPRHEPGAGADRGQLPNNGAARNQGAGGQNAARGEGAAGGGERNFQHQSARRNPHGNRPRITPIGSRKNGEPDLEEKFGRFEINKPAPVPRALSTGTSVSGGELGDETVSLVSDTWSTDVLSSDTETLGEEHGASRMGIMDELMRRGGNHMGMGEARSGSGQRNRLMQDELSVPVGSGNANNLLDVAETASEAWSIDVLASDSESLRLGDLDNEDTASVARSDDTRFTDDPEPFDVLAAAAAAGTGGAIPKNRSRDDVTLLRQRSAGPHLVGGASSASGIQSSASLGGGGAEASGNSINLPKPSRAAAVEQWARQSSGGGRGQQQPPQHHSVVSQAQQQQLLRRGSSDSAGVGGASGDVFRVSNRSNPPRSLNEISILKKQPVAASSSNPMPNSAASGQGPKPGNSENNNGALLPGNLGLGSEPGNGVSLSGNCDNAGVVGQAMGPTPSSSSVEEFGDANSGSNPVATSASGDVVSQLSSHLSVASIASSTESSAESAEAKTRSNNMIGGGGALAAAAASPLNHPPSLLDSDNPMSLPAQNPSQQQPRPHPPSTGAIPKSISFDKNVLDHNSDLGLADAQDGAKGGGGNGKSNSRGDKGFFKSWKLPKIGRSRGGAGGGGNMSALNRNIPGLPNPGLSRSNDYEYGERLTSDDSFNIPEHAEGPAALLRRAVSDETSDDILAKYRKKSASHTTDSIPDSNGSGPDIIDSGGEPFNEEQDERLIIDPMNVESSFAFQDAKRKLRLMLAEADLSSLSNLHQTRKKDSSSAAAAAHHRQGETPDNEIVVFLRVQLAEAHNLQDRSLVAQLHETLRCINLFDSEQCRKLLRSLREDYKRRSPYLSYLVRCRQGLLTTLSHQQRLLSRMEVDQRVCSQYLVSVCVRIFLERKEKQMQQFVYKFKELSVSDEKIALMESFLQKLWRQLEEDPSWALAASEEQMNLGRLTIERAVISQIYMFALYPNGEADVHRDEVLREHILRLSGVITCSHRDLKIPRQYHYEQPWPSAQEEIKRLAAFKTPSDKVACVARCSQTIMNLLSLASSKSVPAADDFVPVMVFVLIKANPQGLLSTVQYVESFYGNRMSGEDQYWWMQFVGAIEFIKTMDYHL